MKKHLTLILALALAGALFADTPASALLPEGGAHIDGVPSSVPPAESYDAVKNERDALKAQLASVRADLQQAQIEAQYFKVLADRNDLFNRLTQAGLQLAEVQRQLTAANEKITELDAKAPKATEEKK